MMMMMFVHTGPRSGIARDPAMRTSRQNPSSKRKKAVDEVSFTRAHTGFAQRRALVSFPIKHALKINSDMYTPEAKHKNSRSVFFLSSKPFFWNHPIG
jgi:hypothetical protein